MTNKIHPTAIVSEKSRIGAGVEIGPYAIVEEDTTIGEGTRILSRAFIGRWTTLGKNNAVHMGAVLGHQPQHESFSPSTKSFLRIGDDNIFREYVTVHRAAKENGETLIGDHNFLMAFSHVGHDSVVHDHVTIGNMSLIAGHVELQDHCVISGGCAIHQFVRIGSYAMIGGNATVTKDVPPYMLVDDSGDKIGSINVIGLRRNGFSEEAKRDIKNAYKSLFLSGLNTSNAIRKIRENSSTKEATFLLDFITKSKRGILPHRKQKDDPLPTDQDA